MVDKIKEKYLSLSEEDRNKFVDKLKREGKRYGVFPLSSLQDTLLYAYITDQQDTSYNIRMKLRFSEQLQTDVLKQSLDYVVAVNASLRSKLFILQDTCFQVVEKPYSVQLPVMEGTASYIDNWLQTSDRAFDLQQEYPIRFQLLKDVEDKECILVLTAHHIFTDGWSFEILVKEIREKYIELCQGTIDGITEKKRSYGEIYLDRAESQTADDYWEKQLKDGMHKVDFESISWKLQITHLKDNEKQTDKCKSNQSVNLASKDLVDKLAVQYGVSAYVVLLSVYLDALHQLSLQESVSTATAVLNRTTKEELESVGLYATLVPVLSSFKAETVTERLAHIKEEVRNAIAYGNVDQRKLINLLMCRDTSEEMYSNVFLFSEQSRKREELGNTGVWMIPENIDNSRNIQYDLLCSINLTGNQYVLSMDYRQKKISKELIEELETLYLKVFHEYVDGIRGTIKTLKTEEVCVCNREKEISEAGKETEISLENCQEEKVENCAERLSAIWKNLLGHDAFEPSDNFFAVGGNSLLAIKLLRQMNESFGVNLKITDIFKYHSLSAMSQHLVTLEE
jgi:hypothetical protein